MASGGQGFTLDWTKLFEKSLDQKLLMPRLGGFLLEPVFTAENRFTLTVKNRRNTRSRGVRPLVGFLGGLGEANVISP